MKLRFSIYYKTKWGESIWVEVKLTTSEGVRKTYLQQLSTDDGERWATEVAVMESRHRIFTSFEYEYQVRCGDDYLQRSEWSIVPRRIPCENAHDYVMNDSWKDIPLMSHLYTKAYVTTSRSDTVAGDDLVPLRLPLYRKTLFFRVSAPQLKSGQSVALCGSHPALGGWSTSRYMKMTYCGCSVWTITMNVDSLFPEIEYKYVVINDSTLEFIDWEGGGNRKVDVSSIRDGEVTVLNDGILRLAESTWRVAGVALPVFSLRSEHSCGVGDFGDVKRIVDWMDLVGLKILQILPVNDTTMQHNWQDSYPYNIISTSALHPQYVDLEQAGKLSDPSLMVEYNRRRAELNALDYTDYEAVERVKKEYLHRLYQECHDTIANNEDYIHFVEKNALWLQPYAAFCILRDKHHTARFTDWGENAVYDRKKTQEICDTDEAHFIFYVQYLLHTQLKQASDYAASKGIILMGDMPIGVSRDSVEAWANSSFFNLDCQAGTVPDNLNRNGQNWGFPTFNWDALEADNYRWWRERLKVMEQFFGAIRIDHALGFFRIWEIPNENVDGLKGHFSPAMPFDESEMGYYGLSFHRDSYSSPIINDNIINRVFGIHANYVRERYLVKKAYDLYDLREECSTQKKIHELFGGKSDENSIWIRDGLCKLAANVLFVADRRNPNMYHPRVNAFSTPAYQLLGTDDRDAFMRLYNNYYYERHNTLWEYVGRRRLSMILKDTRMLTCAEDLGPMPACVSEVLGQLRIPTLEIQTMPKQEDCDFSHLEANPYLSLATITTHDMAPLRLWWQENRQKAQHYFVEMMQKEGRAPEQLTTTLAEEIIARHLYSPSMMCIISLQDWLSMDNGLRSKNPRDERINTPGDSYNRWKYRMHITIERLMEETVFNKKLYTMVKRSRR